MYSVILTELGIVIFENNKPAKSFAFSNPAKEYLSVKKGERGIDDIVGYLRGKEVEVFTNDQTIMNSLKRSSIDVQLMKEDEGDRISSEKPTILVDAGFAKNENDALSKLRDFAIQLSSSKVTEVSESPDLHIIQAINSLDEVDKIINGLSSRVREWYGLHFPELDNVIDSIVGYSQIVVSGRRSDLNEQIFKDAGFPDSKVEMLSLIREKSRGGEISDENLAIVQGLANQILALHQVRKKIEENIEVQMQKIAPNLAVILGTSVAARILARAGSLKKLAAMPASTIQVLGAEKALFRSLKTGSQPPKHGLLFQHALVHAAPRWQRGKIARAVAAKAAIAARVDVYAGQLNQTLLEKLNVRIKEIGNKYEKPVERKPKPQQFKKFEKKRSSRFRNKKRKKFGRR